MRGAALLIVVLASWLVPAAAVADTDYRCLNNCVTSGQPAALCMPACTFTQTKNGTGISGSAASGLATPSAIGTSHAANLTPHHVLTPLQPLDEQILLKPALAPAPVVHEDYHCIAQCLQNKLQYQFCEGSCATVTKRDGSLLKSPVMSGISAPVPVGTGASRPN